MTIIWDWNGTLLDDAHTGVEILNAMLVKRGLEPITRERYTEIFGFPIIDYYKRAGFDMEAEPYESIAQDYIDAYASMEDTLPLRDGALEAVRSLYYDGHRQIILSASEECQIRRMLERTGLDRYINAVYAHSDGYAYGKTVLGRRAVNELDLEAEDCLLIGDTLHDSEVAHALGIECLLVTGGHHHERQLLTAGDPIVSGPAEAYEFILEK